MRIIATTKFVGAAGRGCRGSRVRVRIGAHRPVFVPWDHALGMVENHIQCARKAAAKLGLDGLTRGSAIAPVTDFKATAYSLPDANDDSMIVILETKT